MLRTLALILGYVLCHRSSAYAYLTAYGIYENGTGYVANPLFTYTANIVQVIVVIALFIYWRKRYQAYCIFYSALSCVTIALFLGIALIGHYEMVRLIDLTFLLTVLGLIYGCSYFFMMLCWFELIAEGDSIFRTMVIFLIIIETLKMLF